jgi:hypothetical protein
MHFFKKCIEIQKVRFIVRNRLSFPSQRWSDNCFPMKDFAETGEMLQIMILTMCCSSLEKSARAFSSEQISLKIEWGQGKSQRPPLIFSDPSPIK